MIKSRQTKQRDLSQKKKKESKKEKKKKTKKRDLIKQKTKTISEKKVVLKGRRHHSSESNQKYLAVSLLIPDLKGKIIILYLKTLLSQSNPLEPKYNFHFFINPYQRINTPHWDKF